MRGLSFIVLTFGLLATTIYTSVSVSAPQRRDPAFLYELHCSGCHQRDGSGRGEFVPAMAGEAAVFLNRPGGREFLIRVPGVSQSQLTDQQVAEVMNWLLPHFDPGNMPANFAPYTEAEVHNLRKMPISNPTQFRAVLLQQH